jgi:dTDP-4-dehydrorhamnose 3,5-epimerase
MTRVASLREAFARRNSKPMGSSRSSPRPNVAHNIRKGTVHGMHFQFPPAAETKLVRCTRGAILDIIVDLRPESPTYLQHIEVELNEDNQRALYVPERFAHGYQALRDNTDTSYQVEFGADVVLRVSSSGGGKSEVLNCGYGNGFSVLEVIDAVRRVSGADFPVHFGPRRAGDPPMPLAQIDRIAKCLTGLLGTTISTPSSCTRSIGSGASLSGAPLSRRWSLSFRGVTSIVPPGFYLRLYPLGVPRVVA